MKELRILVEDHLLTTALDAVLPHCHRVTIEAIPGTTYVQVSTPETEPEETLPRPRPRPFRVSPRRFPPDPIVQAPTPVEVPRPVPPGHTRVAAHYNGARYVPEHVRPNPVPHKRRPPQAKTTPTQRKEAILRFMALFSRPVTLKALLTLARQHEEHPHHWRSTIRGMVRYKQIARADLPDGTPGYQPINVPTPAATPPDFTSKDMD